MQGDNEGNGHYNLRPRQDRHAGQEFVPLYPGQAAAAIPAQLNVIDQAPPAQDRVPQVQDQGVLQDAYNLPLPQEQPGELDRPIIDNNLPLDLQDNILANARLRNLFPEEVEMANNLLNNIKNPPLYSGSSESHITVKEFISKFRIYANLRGIQDDINAVFTHLGQFLTDRCFKWYTRLDVADYDDMEALLEALKNAFDRPPSKLNLYNKLQQRKYVLTDTPDSYSDAILEICNKLDVVNEADQINHFLLGLPPLLQAQLSVLNLETFAQAARALKNLENLIPSALTSASCSALHTSQKKDALPEVAAINDKLDELASKLDSQNQSQQQVTQPQQFYPQQPQLAAMYPPQYLPNNNAPMFPNQGQQNSQNSSVICQLCSKRGHFAYNCRTFTQSQQRGPIMNARPAGNNQSNNRQPNPNIICHYCHKRGHIERNCFTKLKQMQNRGQSNRQNQLNFQPRPGRR